MATANKRPLLSVAIIARNAEELLPATLQSVAGIADQIVVLDTGSTDRTVALAREAGAIVVEKPWQDDFAAARNTAWAHVQGRWVLWLDAGETLDAEAAAQLRAFVERQANDRSAYMMLVVVPPAPGQIAGEQVGRVRLAPNHADLRFAGRVNESLLPALAQFGLTLDGLPWQIVRPMSDHNPGKKLAKALRNLKLAALQLQESGETPELLVVIGEASSAIGNYDQAVMAFRQSIATSAEPSSAKREAYYGLLTCLDCDPNFRPEQISVCLAGLQAFPTDAQLLCAMGGYLQAQGELDMAARAYESAFMHGQVDPWTWHVTGIDEIAASCFALIRQLENRDVEAREWIEKALVRLPQSARLRRQLIDLHIKHDRRQDALAQVDQLPGDIPNREGLRSAIRGGCLAAKQNYAAALGYLRTAYGTGCRDVVCLRWMTVTLISLGDLAAAEPVLRQWQVAEPNSAEMQQYLTLFEHPRGAALIDASQDDAAADDGRRLRLDVPATTDGSSHVGPNFSAVPHPMNLAAAQRR